eukprot:2339571-Lingulodinium_polyedra.AAC.1
MRSRQQMHSMPRIAAATTARKPHARALHANNCSHEVHAHAICAPPRQQTIGSTASLRTAAA